MLKPVLYRLTIPLKWVNILAAGYGEGMASQDDQRSIHFKLGIKWDVREKLFDLIGNLETDTHGPQGSQGSSRVIIYGSPYKQMVVSVFPVLLA